MGKNIVSGTVLAKKVILTMRMSVPAYISIGLALLLIILAYVAHPDVSFLFTALPMLLVLIAVPMILNQMNRRHVANVNPGSYQLYRIKDLSKLGKGSPVRLRGKVEAASFKWLNRPHYRINDGSGVIGVFMFTAPLEDIKTGDYVETVGSLWSLGLSKEKKLLGVRMNKYNR